MEEVDSIGIVEKLLPSMRVQSQLQKLTSKQFEKVCAKAMEGMEPVLYRGVKFEPVGRISRVTPRKTSPQGGFDGTAAVAGSDRKVVYECKGGKGTVGPLVVRAFKTVLKSEEADLGILLTSSDFSSGAKAEAHDSEVPVVLVNGAELARELVDRKILVRRTSSGTKELDEDAVKSLG